MMITQTPRAPPRPVLEVSWTLSQAAGGVKHFAYFSVLLQELDVAVEEDFLDRFVSFLRRFQVSLFKASLS